MRQLRRLLSTIFVILGAITVIPVFSGLASAHHSNIVATVACDGTVSWTAKSWSPGSEGTNSDIRVTKTVGTTTTEVGQGVFNNLNNYQFSGTFAWPTGATSITVTSTPNAAWGNHVVSNVGSSVTVTPRTDCPGQPGVSQTVTCVNNSAGHGDGNIVLTLSNSASGMFASDVSFNVYSPDQTSTFTTYVVAKGATTKVTFSGLADGTHNVKITAAGFPDMNQTFVVDCDSPVPSTSLTQACVNGDGQVVVTLSNTGGEAVVFDVTDPKNNNNVEHVSVAADTSTTRTFSGFADGNYTVVVKVAGVDYSQKFTVACDHPGQGSISTVATCVNNDGTVTITLIATGGELPVVFTVNGTQYVVQPGTTKDVVISGLNDGTNHITVLAGQKDLSFDTTTNCDKAPAFSYVQACSNFDDSVTLLMSNPGDDVAVTFTINGTDYVLAPGESRSVAINGLADGQNTITVAINGVAQESIVVQSKCDPVFAVTPNCNSVDVNGAVVQYWFTLANSESTDVSVTWNGGSATVPAGQSIVVGASSAPLILQHNGVEIARASAAEAICERSVIFTKELKGQPETSETYSIRVLRLVGESYVEETTFGLNAGESKTINLPSTLDPAGVDYKIEEINAGTASTSTVSPDQLKLAGHLGETVSVVITNGYAAVQIDKTSSTAAVLPGGQITYNLQAVNTGALTLDPVVVTDRLPSMMQLVSATVAGGAGQCELAQATRPQLVSCTMSGSLAPGASASLITVVVTVDDAVVAGTTIVNQAMVHGAFAAGDGTATLAQKVNNAGAAGGDLSCVPVIAGTVCDLSAKVGVPVTQIQVSPPASASAPEVIAELPATGAGNLRAILALGFGAVLLGGAMVLSKRRLGAR